LSALARKSKTYFHSTQIPLSIHFSIETAVTAPAHIKRNSPDDRWMDRALALARRGEALTSPNPMVGAVLVRNGRVIGEGYHTYDRRKHAEIIALESAGRRARGATLYINLEPCAHRGRTGPCTDAIIAAGVRLVVAAMRDPNPKVAGRGFAKLRAAGIKVEVGLREIEAKRLNESFARWITSLRPFVTLKTAMTLDGAIAWPPVKRGPSRSTKRSTEKRWITSPQSREEVQSLRHASDAILTGIGTILADDPLLTDRTGRPRRRPLLRVVLDSLLRLPPDSKLAKSAKGDVLVFTTRKTISPRVEKLRAMGIEIVYVRQEGDILDWAAVLHQLGKREVLGVLIEAGTRVNSSAVITRAVDKLIVFINKRLAGPGGKPWATQRAARRMKNLRDVETRSAGPDECYTGYFRDVYGNH
jgi:diaminohydroxyphosphoribosylaminopyrimidine deaminase/5-amino-6-(5-phosphoribosylamino)uracil reductase